jgi:hypothetical protein
MKKILALLLSLLVAVSAFAVPLTASWIEGKVEHGSGSAWKVVNIGDKIDSAESVRLAKGAMAEFTEGSRHISLSAPGTYALADLVKAGADQAKNRSAALGKLGKLVDPKAAESATAIAGVRGAAQGESETMWATEGEGPESLAEEAKSFARESRFADAAQLFGQAADASEGLGPRGRRLEPRGHQGAQGHAPGRRRAVGGPARPPPRQARHRFRLLRRGP